MLRSTIAFIALLFVASTNGAIADAPPKTTIRVQGTVIMEPLFAAAAKKYMRMHPGFSVNVHGTSSGEGIAALKSHNTEVSGADIRLNDDQLFQTPVALAGLTFIVGPNTGVKNITLAQVKKIFSGKIINWRQIGGNDQRIAIMEREVGGGSRFIFEQTITQTATPVRSFRSVKKMAALVSKTPGALSYVASYFATKAHATVLSFNGVAPTDRNIASGKYTFVGHETGYILKPVNAQFADFLKFVKSDKADYAPAGLVPAQ